MTQFVKVFSKNGAASAVAMPPLKKAIAKIIAKTIAKY